MSKTKKNYSASFKEKAVKLSYVRGSFKEISEELAIQYYPDGERNQLHLVRIVFQVKQSQNSQMNSEK